MGLISLIEGKEASYSACLLNISGSVVWSVRGKGLALISAEGDVATVKATREGVASLNAARYVNGRIMETHRLEILILRKSSYLQ